MLTRTKAVLWNEGARRIRLPWRLGLWLALLVLLGLLATAALGVLWGRSIEPLLALFTPGRPGDQTIVAARNLLFVSSQLFVMVGSVYLAGRFLDRRWFRDFGFRLDRNWWIDLGFGLGLGAVLMTGVFAFELLAGWITVRELFFIARADFAFWPWFGWGFVTFLAVGVYEELVFRGYLITNLAEGFTWFDRVDRTAAVGIATVLTSAVFGVAHAGNPNATLASTLGIVLAAVTLAAGYVLTGELAIPIGLHATWNFFQGTVYGFPVSGTNNGVSLVAIEQSGPSLVTGGAFGPEAGLVGIGAIGIGLALTVLWVRWRTDEVRFDPSLVTPELRHR
ncbi:CPBP family intramembrane glutamic endopeptidase [Halobellus litoreus]|uniref:CPBP family intramembrane glutamic endopeptidase n=1 Tax=Halobellus litoreus TaxID=755310 RepID=A0ABD6DW94_9EURY|nr:CPBP family intramembrane glutamic endopeptidase [Halobellus litoreus]